MTVTDVLKKITACHSRAPRADGVEARARLLHTAVHLFAEKGFANTSTRELATAAGVNIAAISYYFGDKAGLYRAAYTEPMGDCAVMNDVDLSTVSLEQGLRLMFTHIAEPLKQGEIVQLCTRLHFREMLEPTGLWARRNQHRYSPRPSRAVADAQFSFGLRAARRRLAQFGAFHRGVTCVFVHGARYFAGSAAAFDRNPRRD